jgi:hypothetical protein
MATLETGIFRRLDSVPITIRSANGSSDSCPVPTDYYMRLSELNLHLSAREPARMFRLILHSLRGRLRSRESLILENIALRRQLQVLSWGETC